MFKPDTDSIQDGETSDLWPQNWSGKLKLMRKKHSQNEYFLCQCNSLVNLYDMKKVSSFSSLMPRS